MTHHDADSRTLCGFVNVVLQTAECRCVPLHDARCTGGRVATQLTGGARGCAVKLAPVLVSWLSRIAIAALSV